MSNNNWNINRWTAQFSNKRAELAYLNFDATRTKVFDTVVVTLEPAPKVIV